MAEEGMPCSARTLRMCTLSPPQPRFVARPERNMTQKAGVRRACSDVRYGSAAGIGDAHDAVICGASPSGRRPTLSGSSLSTVRPTRMKPAVMQQMMAVATRQPITSDIRSKPPAIRISTARAMLATDITRPRVRRNHRLMITFAAKSTPSGPRMRVMMKPTDTAAGLVAVHVRIIPHTYGIKANPIARVGPYLSTILPVTWIMTELQTKALAKIVDIVALLTPNSSINLSVYRPRKKLWPGADERKTSVHPANTRYPKKTFGQAYAKIR
mmetsp:Transcript_26469/g.69577  ORF Transcript_26469/g.69577 Transcript_26469/m.69577 type:complete len:270 (-) Transcript_26469:50-859(-)